MSRLKVKELKKTCHIDTNKKKSGVAKLVSKYMSEQWKLPKTEDHFIIIKG